MNYEKAVEILESVQDGNWHDTEHLSLNRSRGEAVGALVRLGLVKARVDATSQCPPKPGQLNWTMQVSGSPSHKSVYAKTKSRHDAVGWGNDVTIKMNPPREIQVTELGEAVLRSDSPHKTIAHVSKSDVESTLALEDVEWSDQKVTVANSIVDRLTKPVWKIADAVEKGFAGLGKGTSDSPTGQTITASELEKLFNAPARVIRERLLEEVEPTVKGGRGIQHRFNRHDAEAVCDKFFSRR